LQDPIDKALNLKTFSYRFANLEDAEIIHQYTQEVFLTSQNLLLLPDYLIDSIKGDELGIEPELTSHFQKTK